MSSLIESDAWHDLAAHRDELADVHMREQFRADPGRAERFTVEACGNGRGEHAVCVHCGDNHVWFGIEPASAVGVLVPHQSAFTVKAISGVGEKVDVAHLHPRRLPLLFQTASSIPL